MRQRITHIAVHQTSRIFAVLYFILGIILVPFILLGTIAGQQRGAGAGAALVFPFLYGAAGYVGTAILLGLYNVLARYLGGMELELTPVEGAIPVTPRSSF